jgi:hypothetical protein
MELALAFTGLELTRPLALGALALPLAVWFLARTASAARPIATGTFAIWSLVAERDPQAGTRRRARPSPALWCVLAALGLGALALAGPRLPAAPAGRTWRLYLDRRPAMFLESAGSTRIARGVAEAQRWLKTAAHAGDEVIWYTPSTSSSGPWIASAPGNAPPSEWLEPPRIPLSAPDWIGVDRRWALWITDRPPPVEPQQAVLVTSGGDAVPGPIDASGTTRWDWDGERIVAVPGGAPARRVAIEGDLARPLAGVLAAWAAARGLSLEPSSEAPVALRLISRSTGEEREVVAGRDGWRARGRARGAAPSADEDGDLETWLAAEGGTRATGGAERPALMTHGPGRVWSSWTSMETPAGDPAAFAVSLATLFDACSLSAAGVVLLRDRTAAGKAEVRAPPESPPDASQRAAALGAEAAALRLDPWLAWAALLLVLAALAFTLLPRICAARPNVARARSIG